MADCSLIKKEIILGGLNCAHCAEEINEKVSKMKEIESSNLNFIMDELSNDHLCVDSALDQPS